MGTPLGESTTFYIKAKIEKFANYSQSDGMVLKYTIYEVVLIIHRITRS